MRKETTRAGNQPSRNKIYNKDLNFNKGHSCRNKENKTHNDEGTRVKTITNLHPMQANAGRHTRDTPIGER